MTAKDRDVIERAEIVLPGGPLDRTLAFFVDELGFRVATIVPADAPREAVVVGYGLRIRLDTMATGAPGHLRLACTRRPVSVEGRVEAPNGTRIEWTLAEPAIAMPPSRPSFVLCRAADAAWGGGRAGMQYRDLIPGRQGGRFIASHIRIEGGGAVPDYAHYHAIRFQMIYCYRGWVRVVYEDQGDPFVLHAGDCVLQPPRIRHRVLESSPGLEVIEIGCPAEHETFGDLEITLPTGVVRPDRSFRGQFGEQRFVRHVAADAAWFGWTQAGLVARDLGIADATDRLANVVVVRVDDAGAIDRADPWRPASEFEFAFVLSGSARLAGTPDGDVDLATGDAVVVPPTRGVAWRKPSADFECLSVRLPGPAA